MEEGIALPRISPLLVVLLRPVHSLFIPLFFRIKVRGASQIPATGPVILTPTHRSRWDPMIMPYLTRRLLRTMASHDEFVGVQGWFMRRLGAFPVNTRRPSASTLKICEQVLRSRDLLVIYPEGTIYYYPPDHVHPLKPGTAWLALKAQQDMPEQTVQVVPVRIRYGKLRPKFRTAAEVVVQPPLAVSDFTGRPEREGIRALTEAIQERMGDVLNTSAKEMIEPRDPNAIQRRGVYGSPRAVPETEATPGGAVTSPPAEPADGGTSPVGRESG